METKTLEEIEALADEFVSEGPATLREAFIHGYMKGTKDVMTAWMDHNDKEIERLRS